MKHRIDHETINKIRETKTLKENFHQDSLVTEKEE